MLKRIMEKLKALLGEFDLNANILYYIGTNDALPSPLEQEEETSLVRRMDAGDESVKSALIEHNLRLVVYIARRFDNSGVDLDDLISVGTIGLIKAVNSFNSDKNIKLATYASRCIENEILMLIRSNKKHKNNVYLFDPVGVDKEGNELTLMDLLFEKEEGVFKAVESRMVREKFLRVLEEVLTEREYTVLCLRYGLKGGAPMPQREVAAFLKISRSYISRIEKRAIERVRACIDRSYHL